MFLRTALVGACAALLSRAASVSSQITFNKDVLTIMQKRCQGCHRPGEVAPMSFLTYSEVRPWAKAIREAVLTRKMPPWFADPHYGKFSNDRSLDQGRDRHARFLGGCRRARGRSQRRAAACRMGGWLEHRQTRRGFRDAARFRCAGRGHHRVSVHRHSIRIHEGHMGTGCRSAAGQPAAGASHHRLRAPAGFRVAEGRQAGHSVRSSGEEGRGRQEKETRRRPTKPRLLRNC